MIYFFSFIFFIFSVILISDFLPDFYTWLNRIKIGKYSNDHIWQEKVVQKSISWLNNIPKTKIKDENRLLVLDILKNQYTNKALQSWQEASLLLGLNEIFIKTQNSELKTHISKFIHTKIDANGNWISLPKEVDTALLAFAISEVSFIDEKCKKPALDYIYTLLKSKIGADGTIMYRAATQNFRYVDTVGFVCPFLTKYGLEFEQEEAVDLAISQIKYFEKFGLLDNKIPCHAYEIHTKNPVGIFGWGRGVAWFIIGVLETYKQLPDNHQEKKYLQNILSDLAKTLKKYQKENGSFSWNIFLTDDRSDSSATAVFAWLFKEINYNEEAIKALDYLKSVTRRNGAIDFSQGDTKAIGVYSQNFDILPFTQGFVLKTLY
jgi:unsaturated rhamnogalacturonyl hydrolase